MKNIEYRDGADLAVEIAIELYNASGLGERRPVDDPSIFSDMLRHANLTVTAWDGDLPRRHLANPDRFFLRRIPFRPGHPPLPPEARHRNRAHPEDTRKDGASFHARSALRAAGGRVLPTRRICAAPQRVGAEGGRSVSEVAASYQNERKDGRGRPSLRRNPLATHFSLLLLPTPVQKYSSSRRSPSVSSATPSHSLLPDALSGATASRCVIARCRRRPRAGSGC